MTHSFPTRRSSDLQPRRGADRGANGCADRSGAGLRFVVTTEAEKAKPPRPALGGGVGSVLIRVPPEHRFERLAEGAGDAEGDFERRRIFALLDRRDRLAGDADAVAEFALRHLAGQEAQRADVVGKRGLSHASPSDSSKGRPYGAPPRRLPARAAPR